MCHAPITAGPRLPPRTDRATILDESVAGSIIMDSALLRALDERILVLDGAMGTSVHTYDLPLSDYRGLENCTEILCLSRPDVIGEIHSRFLEVGCDAVETNTFGANKIVLAEFGLTDQTRELNRAASRIAREACNRYSTADQPRFVIGSIGPGTKLATLRQTTFDVLEDSYSEQIRGLMDGEVDGLLFETCQDILQAKAGLAAAETVFAECGRRVPIMVQVTMETTGTMLVGCDIAAALTVLDAYPQIEVIGLNCATGPEQMSEHIRYLSEHCTRRISVVPNAGLPEVVDGRPRYPLSPEGLTRWLVEFVEQDGVNVVGGCCGTTPEHMEQVVKAMKGRKPVPRHPQSEPSISSLYQSVSIRQENSFLIIGERTNANGSKKFREMLAVEDFDGMVQMAREQVKAGSHMIDVCTAYVGRDEISDMTRLVARLATEVPVPLMIDSTEAPVIDAALKLVGGRCIVNSVNLEDGETRCADVLPMCRKYGAAVVALTIDEEGMAKTADRKVAVAHRLFDLVTGKYGLRPGDLLFDPLTFTICTGNTEDRRLGLETLDAIRRIKQELPECHILLGLSNISFGIKPAARHVLNSVFLHYAREAGLDAAIIHAGGFQPLYKIDEKVREIARKLIFDEREGGYDPLADLLAQFPDEASARPKIAKREAVSIEERLKQRIIDGDRTGLTDDLDEAMRRYRPLDIINELLLPGMKVVGDLFGAGQMQLPFVLQSAETMKAAVAHLEPFMERTDVTGKGSIVLATVKGDVHDIGKNLVDILLTNNGFNVHNLGIKVPINTMIDTWQAHKAQVVGMSGLLVKSTVVMRDNLLVLNERGLTPTVILGGAALTRSYVEKELRPLYHGALFYARDAFEGLDLMRQICEQGPESVPVRAVREKEPGEEEIAVGCVRPSAPRAARVEGEQPRRSAVATDVPIPTPPFWGERIIEEIPLTEALSFINEVMLFQMQWQFKKRGRPQKDFDKLLDETIRPIYRDLVARCDAEKILQPRVIYGYWPCQSEGESLIVYDPHDRARELVRFDFPRQQKPPWWCLSDFWRPKSTGEYDVLGMSVVTMGPHASEVAREWFEAGKYTDYLYLHGLSVEGAESLAEWLHKKIRIELGIAGQDSSDLRKLFQQGYQGSRRAGGSPQVTRRGEFSPPVLPRAIQAFSKSTTGIKPVARSDRSIWKGHVDDLQFDGGSAVVGVEDGLEGHAAAAVVEQRLEHVLLVKGDGLAGDAAVGERELDVLTVPADRPRLAGQFEHAGRELRFGVAHAEGLELLQLVDQRIGQVGQADLGIQAQRGFEVPGGERPVGQLDKRLGKRLDPVTADLEARGHGVSAEAVEMIGALGQGLMHLEIPNAAGRALPRVLLQRDEHRRPAVAVHDPRSDDPDDAGMPFLARQHDRPAGIAGQVAGLDHLGGLGEDLPLGRLSPSVLAFQVSGDLLCTSSVGQCEQFDGQLGMTHAPGGVEPRGEPEAHMLAVDLLVREPRRLDQRPQAHQLGVVHAQQPESGEDPILAGKRHDVGDGAESRQAGGVDKELAEVGPDPFGLRERSSNSPGEFERDAGTADIRVGVAGQDGRMHDHVGLRQRGAGCVMIGDDQGQADLAGDLGFLYGGDAAVHGNHRVGPIPANLPQGLGVDAIPFLQAVGHVERDPAAGQGQQVPQDGRRGNSVDVVVSVDDDRPSLLDLTGDDSGGFDGPGERLGGQQSFELGVQEGSDGLGVGHASVMENLGKQGMNSQLPSGHHALRPRRSDRPVLGHPCRSLHSLVRTDSDKVTIYLSVAVTTMPIMAVKSCLGGT